MEMRKQNYQNALDKILDSLSRKNGKKPSLLLHACCAPCSSYVLEYLNKFFDITIYYYNPNIHPEAEYTRRLEELKRFLIDIRNDGVCPRNDGGLNDGSECGAFGGQAFNLVQAEYDAKEFFDAVQAERDGLEREPEKGERCRRCYRLRMEHAFEYAVKNKFDWWTTTLSISPHKDAEKINAIGLELQERAVEQNAAEKMTAARFLTADFKKRNGFKRSLELSEKYGLYRQDYCGCVYSRGGNDGHQ